MPLSAHAKLNLFLHVAPARSDGYHELQSLVAFAEYGDYIDFQPTENLSLDVSGPFAAALEAETGAGDDNIVLRAARALAKWAQEQGRSVPGAAISLTKNLPVASGIGGGSADAAAALKGLADLWGLRLGEADWARLALSLGADVPVCLLGRAAWMEGVGERLETVVLPSGLSVVLVNPGFSLSTAAVFQAFDAMGRSSPFRAGAERPTAFAGAGALLAFLRTTRNDLEPVARLLAPEISEVIRLLDLTGAALVRLSGSGATCFGLYEDSQAAQQAVNHIRSKSPHWWVQASTLMAG